MAFSDGTLIAGEYDPEEERFFYLIEVIGAGNAQIDGGTVAFHGDAEWVTIATYRPDVAPLRLFEPLPLFEAVRG